MQNTLAKSYIPSKSPNESQRNAYSCHREIESSSCASGPKPLMQPGTCSLTSITSVIPQHPNSNYSSHGESLELLKDRIKKRQSEVRKAFNMFRLSKQNPHILKTHFRLVLDTFCFPLSDAQFQDIITKCIPANDAIMNYEDFLKQYGSVPQEVVTSEIIGRSITLEEMEMKIHTKISENIKPVCLAFQLFDHSQDGKVQCYELEKVIENFCGLKFSKESYQRLWSRYDQRDSGLIDYQEFLKKLALSTSQYQNCLPNLNMKIALTWPDANLDNYNKQKQRLALLNHSDDPMLQGLPLEQIEDLLQRKIISEYNILKRAFLVMDPKGSGSVPYSYFRSTLIHFTYPMSQQLFSQMMQRMGVKQSEKIRWKTFLNHVCKQKTPESFIQTTIDSVLRNRQRTTTSDTFSQIIIKLSKIGIQPGINTLRSFNLRNKFCSPDDLFITRQELRLMIERKGNPLSENEMKDLMVALDPGHTNFISYSKFCKLFGCNSNNDKNNKSEPHTEAVKYQAKNTRLQSIPWDKLLGKLKSKVHRNYDIIEKSLGACDYEQKGWILSQQLRQVLHKFCFQVTDAEFERILQMSDVVDDIVNIRRFLDTFRETEKERLQNWSTLVSHLAKVSSPKPWSQNRLDILLKEVMSGDRQNFLNSFQEYDIQGKGTIAKDDVSKVIYKHMGRFSELEFEMIWSKLPIDKYGLFDYVTFFENYDVATVPTLETGQARHGSELSRRMDKNHFQDGEDGNQARSTLIRQSPVMPSYNSGHHSLDSANGSIVSRNQSPILESPSMKSSKSKALSASQNSELRPVTSVMTLVRADLHLHQVLARKWRHIRQQCEVLDANRSGIISSSQFLEILSKSGIPISTKPVLHLLRSKYNLCLDGNVSYINFFRDIFLTIGKSNNRDFKKMQFIHKALLPEETPQIYSILLDLRTPVLSKYKSLQKALRRYDILGNGRLTISKFRKILQEFGITVTNEEFHKLVNYLDSQNMGTICYKEFLKIFMKSAS